MITRFFKKKNPPPPARKAVKTEPSKAKVVAHQKTLTAEGWKRMMMRERKIKKK